MGRATAEFNHIFGVTMSKGGRRAVMGEVRTWGNGQFKKTPDGWVPVKGGHHGADPDAIRSQNNRERTQKINEGYHSISGSSHGGLHVYEDGKWLSWHPAGETPQQARAIHKEAAQYHENRAQQAREQYEATRALYAKEPPSSHYVGARKVTPEQFHAAWQESIAHHDRSASEHKRKADAALMPAKPKVVVGADGVRGHAVVLDDGTDVRFWEDDRIDFLSPGGRRRLPIKPGTGMVNAAKEIAHAHGVILGRAGFESAAHGTPPAPAPAAQGTPPAPAPAAQGTPPAPAARFDRSHVRSSLRRLGRVWSEADDGSNNVFTLEPHDPNHPDLEERVNARLDSDFGPGMFYVDVGEDLVTLQLTEAGRKAFGSE